MGALTLKSFPFELRGWDITSYESIDPTDSFGQNVQVYIENNQVLKIEPLFSNKNQSNNWITDKARHFFDGLFDNDKNLSKNIINSNKTWENMFKIMSKIFYTLNICNLKKFNKIYFLLIFEYLNIESLNFLYTITKTYSFIKLKRAEVFKLNNNLESNFQLNLSNNKTKLFSSSLCILLNTNTRYENSNFNLQLRQRNLKGNFKVFSIGSYYDLTFPTLYLGSSFLTLKTIIEGNSYSCQDFKMAENPILVTNTECFKRNDFMSLTKILKFSNIINQVWNGVNVLNSNISEVGTNLLSLFSFLNIKDLLCSNSIYIINVTLLNIKNLIKFTEFKLLNFINLPILYKNNVLLIDQTNKKTNFLLINNKKLKFKNYLYLPTTTFFENNETFINTEGVTKRITKLVFKQKTKSNWQLIRKFSKKLQNLTTNNNVLTLYDKNQYIFKNYINFHYAATQTFIDLNFYLNVRNNSFFIYKKHLPFKMISIKNYNTKIKYWLDDFFAGVKDNYCCNSLILTNCSLNIRAQSTNFF